MYLESGKLIPFEGVAMFSMQGEFSNIMAEIRFFNESGTKVGSVQVYETSPRVKIDLANYPTAVKYRIEVKRGRDNEKCSGIVYPMLNIGTSVLPYEKYEGDVLEIPSTVQDFEGYGFGVDNKYTNHIDLEKLTWNRMVKRSVKVDGGQVVSYATGNGKGIYITIGNISAADYVGGENRFLCNKYPTVTANETYLGVNGCAVNSLRAITIYDVELQTVEAWKAKIKEWNDAGKPLEFIFAIKTPIVTDISDIITADNFIEVYEGGSIIAENSDILDTPTTTTYQLKEVKS
jgi:hypothetical protein